MDRFHDWVVGRFRDNLSFFGFKWRSRQGPRTIDLTIAGFDDVTERGYLQDRYLTSNNLVAGGLVDVHDDLVLQLASYEAPWSIVQFRRRIDTGDWPQDVALTVRSMSYSPFAEKKRKDSLIVVEFHRLTHQ